MRLICATILAVIIVSGITAQTHAQNDTTFTYQGLLNEAGAPADGSYNIDISLWDAVTNGTQIGSEVMFNGLAVSEGMFSIQLDFGANALDNSDRWLEISVDGTELSPRQQVTRAPYAIQTRGISIGDDGNVTFNSMAAVEGLVTMSSIGGIDVIIDADTNKSGEDQNARIVMKQDGGQVVARMGYREGANSLEVMQEWPSNLILGTDNQDRITITKNGFVGIGTSTPDAELNVVGDGSGSLVKLTNGGSGGGTGLTIADVSNGGRAASFYGVTSNDVLRVQNDGTGNAATFIGKVGIGTTTPVSPLEVVSAGSRTISAHNTAASGITYGVRAESESINGTGVFGWASANSGVTYGVRGRNNSTSGTGVFGRASATSGINYGVRGVSNSTSGFDFFAAGVGSNYGATSSIRWKSNIRNIESPLEKIAQLRGVYYDWDEDHGGAHDVGMIAEEVGLVLPEIVQYEANGIAAIGMDYSKMTPLLVEAVNALRAEKDTEIAELRERITELERLIMSSTAEDQTGIASRFIEEDK
ncbi:tail fiber domain-containing protein [Phycisphaeraceae bacterium AH-315-B13]|nr:tail fiber domain-containing protein [Phycisphaeraceae bacterium AH-315-B13]